MGQQDAAAVTGELDVLGELVDPKSALLPAEGSGRRRTHIGLGDLVDDLRRHRIDRAAIVAICAAFDNAVLILEGERVYALSLAARNDPIRSDLQSRRLKQVAFGKRHLIGVDVAGRLVTFGDNEYGQLGMGHCRDQRALLPMPHFAADVAIAAVAVGARHSAAIDQHGNMFTWGDNAHGQLGLSQAGARLACVPRYVAALAGHDVRQVACGDHFTLALTGAGRLFAWGDGLCGQLGVGIATCMRTPVHVPIAAPVRHVSCGAGHVLAVDVAGQVYAWGLATSGQLGAAGSGRAKVVVPTAIEGLAGVVDVVCGPNRSVVLDARGVVRFLGGARELGPAAGEPAPVDRIAQTGASTICLTRTCIRSVSARSLCARGGTPFEIVAQGVTDRFPLAYARFARHRDQGVAWSIDVECPIRVGGAPGTFVLDVAASPNLLDGPVRVGAEEFPLALALAVSCDGASWSAATTLSVFRERDAALLDEPANRCRAGPVAGGSQVELHLELDDVDYARLLVRLTNGRIATAPAGVARYDAARATIAFTTPPVPEAGPYRYEIALDGAQFQSFPRPVFDYVDVELVSVAPSALPLGGGRIAIVVTGLADVAVVAILSPQIVLFATFPDQAETALHLARFDANRLEFDLPARRVAGPVRLDLSVDGSPHVQPGAIVDLVPPRIDTVVPAMFARGAPAAGLLDLTGAGLYDDAGGVVVVVVDPASGDAIASAAADVLAGGGRLRTRAPLDVPATCLSASVQVEVRLGALSCPPVSVAVYDAPSSFKLEPAGGVAGGGYPVRIQCKFAAPLADRIRVRLVGRCTQGDAHDHAQYAAGVASTDPPHPKTGLSFVSFTMPSWVAIAADDDGTACSCTTPAVKAVQVELALNGREFVACGDVPFSVK